MKCVCGREPKELAYGPKTTFYCYCRDKPDPDEHSVKVSAVGNTTYSATKAWNDKVRDLKRSV